MHYNSEIICQNSNIQDNKICTFEFDIIAILIYQQRDKRDTNHSLQNVLHFFQLHLKTLFGKLLFWALQTCLNNKG